MDIVSNDRRGLWNVPYISSCYLLSAGLIRDPAARPDYSHTTLEPDMAFAKSLRNGAIFYMLIWIDIQY